MSDGFVTSSFSTILKPLPHTEIKWSLYLRSLHFRLSGAHCFSIFCFIATGLGGFATAAPVASCATVPFSFNRTSADL
jgi:hypothetical protein